MKTVKRLVVNLLLLAPLLLVLHSCDLSVLVHKKEDNPPPPPPPPPPAVVFVQSYVISAAQNPSAGLTADVAATIDGTNISIVLPYSVVQNQTKLIPTITPESGYTIAVSAPFTQTDGMTLVCTRTSDSTLYSLTLHVSVDPNSAAYLNLAKPFYYDSNGIKQDLTEKSTITLDSSTNTYTLTLVTDSFSVNHAEYDVQALLSRPIGFSKATVAPGSSADLSTTLSGAVLPYTVTVQSSNNSVTNVFTINVTRTLSYVQSYVLSAAQNPSLKADVTAIINGPNIYMMLPYSVVQNQTKLIPTITMQSGYTIGVSGAFEQIDGKLLVATKTSDSSVYNFTLHVSVDPNSSAYLNLANPFYYDSNGVRQDLTSNATIALNVKTNTYTITLFTDSFSLNYPAYSVQAILARPIGFTTTTVPYGSYADVSKAMLGAVAPYSITVQSPDKSTTNTFAVNVVRTLSSNVAVTDTAATINYIYDYNIVRAFADSSLGTWLATQFDPELTGGSKGHTDFYTPGPWINNATAFTMVSGWTSDYVICGTPAATAAANAAWWNSLPGTEGGGTITNGNTIMDFGKNWSLTGPTTSPALPNSNPGTVYSTYTPYCSWSAWGIWGGWGSYTGGPTLSIPIARTEVYSGRSYCQFVSIVVKLPSYITVTSMTPMSSVLNWNKTTSSDGNDWVYTFNMVNTLNRVTGAIANFVLKAEDGTNQTYYLALN